MALALFCTASFAQTELPTSKEVSPATRQRVQGLVPGMKYSALKYIYDYRDYDYYGCTQYYSTTGAGIASFMLPGLGQILCGEKGRGWAWLGGALGAAVVCGVGEALSRYGDSQEVGLTIAAVGAKPSAGLALGMRF